jgi:hypothetical protein
MTKKIREVFSVITFLLCFTALAFGQETTGRIEGTILDPSGAAVPGVTVTVNSVGRTDGARPDATTGFTRTATTDESGFFRVQEVPPGFYSVTTTAISGFSGASVPSVEVVLGKTTPVKISLQAGNVSETVTVTSDAVAIDPTDNKIQTNITSQVAELLPKGTNFASLLQVAPSVRNEPTGGGFQIDGASGSENTFIIDGQEVTNFRTGTLDNNNNIPFQFVQEVQVKSSGFEAEFGGATGGVINVVTKSGSNDWHGEFGLQFQPAELQAGPRRFLFALTEGARYFQPRRDDGTDFFPTANFSGPIVRDRAWFFLSYTPQFINTIRDVTFSDPDTGEVAGNGRFTQSQRREYAFARVDANLMNNLRFTGSFTWNPIIVQGIPPLFGEELTTTIPSAVFGGSIGTLSGSEFLNQRGGRQNSNNTNGKLDWTPTSKLLISVRGGYSYLNEKLGSYGVPPAFGNARIFCSAASLGTIPAEAQCQRGTQTTPFTEQLLFDASRRRTLDADASYLVSNFMGRHQFKGGLQLNALSNDVFTTFIDQVSLRYGRTINETSGIGASILPPSENAIGSGFIQRFATQGSASSTNTGFYIQDSYQPVNRLSLNFGVRAERESAPSFVAGRPSVEFGFADKVAPRLGAAYDLTGDGRTKLFASYGWFYDRFKYELPRGSFGGDFFRLDYFEIFPGAGPYSSFTPARILGGLNVGPGGQCPIPGRGPGQSRCQLDQRIPSNVGLGIEFGAIDPDIRPFRQSEFTVGMERDLGGGFLLSSRYTHKQVDQAIEDIGFSNAQGSEAFIIGNPGRGLAAEVAQSFGFIPVGAERKYDAFEIRIDKRFTRRYYFNANYTLSRLFGNYAGLASSDEVTAGAGRNSPNVNRNFDQPFIGFTSLGQLDNGRLPTDRPHVFKFYGAYTLDWAERFGLGRNNSTEFSGFTTIQSGTPVTSRFTFFNIDNQILTQRGDLGRTEAFTQTDFALRHKYRFGTNERLTMVFDLDIINAFNESNVLTIFENIAPGLNFAGEDFGLSANRAVAEAEFQRQNTSAAILNAINENGGRDARYGQPTTFQGGRQVRFGFRLLF